MSAALSETYGNPSSLHAAGRAAREIVERARREVAALVHALPDEVVFTSGGTEADQMAVWGAARAARAKGRGTHIVTSAIEHPAIVGATEALREDGFEVTVVPVSADGLVDSDAFVHALRKDTVLATVQLANHELGTLQPIAELASAARERGVPMHTDAVQAAGKVPVDMAALGVAWLSLSAHKLGGPKGTGALIVQNRAEIEPLLTGGHQERERRGGTENVPGIAGFGMAAAIAQKQLPQWASRMVALRDRFEQGALALSARCHGARVPRVPNTSNVAWEGVSGELLAINLDLAGVAVSTGAACTSGSLAPSPVLLALGQVKTRAQEALRISVGPDNTEGEIDAVLALLPDLLTRVRAAG
jgi:cysteine desulfurase